MIESIILVFGMGLVGLLILIFMHALDDKQIILKLLLSFFLFFIVILMAKGILDTNSDCSIIVANQLMAGNYTSFSYAQMCFPTGKNTPLIFYKASIWMMILYFMYIFVYINYYLWVEKFMKNWGFIKEK